MVRRTWAALLVLYAGLAAGRQIVLVDRSGSMQPYYEQEAIHDLTRDALAACAEVGPTDLAVFSTTIVLIKSTDDSRFDYERFRWSFTEIDSAAQYVLDRKYDIAWLITDNIQHNPGDREGANLDNFYQILRSPRVASVHFLPITQPAGTQGLAAYALLMRTYRQDDYLREIDAFTQRVKSRYATEALKIKPLRDAIVVLHRDKTPRVKRCEVGQRVRDSAFIGFYSRFKHIGLRNARIVAYPPKLRQLTPDAVLRVDTAVYRVQPDVVRELVPGQRTGLDYKFSYDLGRVRQFSGLGPFIKAATALGKVKMELNMPVGFVVAEQDLILPNSYVAKYAAKSPDDARESGKIYGVHRAPLQLNAAPSRYGTAFSCTTSVRVPIEADYGCGPGAVCGLLLVTLVIAAVAGIRALSGWLGQHRLRLVAVIGRQERVCDVREDTGEVLLDDETLGAVDPEWRFRPAAGYRMADGAASLKLVPGRRVTLNRPNGSEVVLVCQRRGFGAPSTPSGPGTTPARRSAGDSQKPLRR